MVNKCKIFMISLNYSQCFAEIAKLNWVSRGIYQAFAFHTSLAESPPNWQNILVLVKCPTQECITNNKKIKHSHNITDDRLENVLGIELFN